MIKISIKNGNLDDALEKLNAAKKEENRLFDEKVAAYFAPKEPGKDQGRGVDKDKSEAKAAAPETPKPPAISYASILARSRRAS